MQFECQIRSNWTKKHHLRTRSRSKPVSSFCSKCWQRRSHVLIWSLVCSFTFCFQVAADDLDSHVATVPKTQSLYEDSLYFEILWPHSLRYTYKIRLAQNFGPGFNKFLNKVDLILSDPDDACQDLYNNVKGGVVLALRGQCSFVTKALAAQKAGAIATIIADNDLTNDDKMIDMVDDETNRSVGIPSAFLVGKDGDMIRTYMYTARTDRVIISIPVNITGKPFDSIKRPPWTVW